MKYDEILARSFSRHEQKKFKYGAFVGCFLVALCFCIVFKPYLRPLPILNLRLKMGDGWKLEMISDETNKSTSKPQQTYVEIKETKLICNTSKQRSDICEINGDIRIQGNLSTIFVVSSSSEYRSWTIKPYARKGDQSAMRSVRNFTIKAVQEQEQKASQIFTPNCTQTHNVTAIVFSVGGYAGNNFHAFTDVIIPLYATSREFNGEVQFLIANKRSQWTKKFQEILQNLSRYEIIDIDKENKVHCFSRMIVGLKKERKELNIDPSTSSYSMKDFKRFLRSSYSLKKETAIKLRNGVTKKPRLLIVSRRKTRAFENEREVVNGAQKAGFEVIVIETSSNLTWVSKVVNSCDVMMGVHGAGLTNMVFLPENAVMIQIVPWGQMEWIASTYFEKPSNDMGLKYLEYKISENESSLIEQYPLDHQVFKDPIAFHRKGWGAFRSIYLDKQNVKIDVARFRATLLKALELLQE